MKIIFSPNSNCKSQDNYFYHHMMKLLLFNFQEQIEFFRLAYQFRMNLSNYFNFINYINKQFVIFLLVQQILLLKIIHHYHSTLSLSHHEILHIQKASNFYLFSSFLAHFFQDSFQELLNFFFLIIDLRYAFAFYHKYPKIFPNIIFLFILFKRYLLHLYKFISLICAQK